LDALYQQLHDRDYQKRLAAVQCINATDPTGVVLLVKALRDPMGRVRAQALVQLQQSCQPEIQALLQTLRYRQMQCLHTIAVGARSHRSPNYHGIRAVDLSPNAQWIVSTVVTGRMQLWHRVSGKLLLEFATLDHQPSVVRFNPDGRTLISGGGDGQVVIWDGTSGQRLQSWPAHGGWVSAIALAADGHTLISGGCDRTLKVWDLWSGQLQHTLTGHTDGIQALSLSSDGQTLVSAGADGLIGSWNWRKRQLIGAVKVASAQIHALAHHPHTPLVASGDQRARLSLWELSTSQHYDTFPCWTYRPIQAILFSPDGEVLLHSCGGGINVWHWATGWLVHTLVHHRWAVTSLAMSADGRILVSGSEDGTIKIWGWPDR
jgi:WD40 repeat protein